MPSYRGRNYALQCSNASEAEKAVVKAAEKLVAKMTKPHQLSKRGRSAKLELWEAVQELHHWQDQSRVVHRTGPS